MTNLTFSQDLAFALYESKKEYPVQFKDAWRWLGYPDAKQAKDDFFTCGFVASLDFKLTLSKDNKSLRLTTDCLKTWGLMSKLPQGKLVRLRCLECERVMVKKMDQHLANMSERQRVIAENMAEQDERMKEIDRKMQQFKNPNDRFYTIFDYADLLAVEISVTQAETMGMRASEMCRKLDKLVMQVNHPDFGRQSAYPEFILQTLPF